MLTATIHDRATQLRREFVRKFVGLVSAIDIDGLASRVHNHLTVMTRAEVFLHLGKQLRVDLTVKVVGKFRQKIGAIHFKPSSGAMAAHTGTATLFSIRFHHAARAVVSPYLPFPGCIPSPGESTRLTTPGPIPSSCVDTPVKQV